MQHYIVPRDWLVAISLLSVGAGLIFPLTLRHDWIGTLAVATMPLLVVPVLLFGCYCIYSHARTVIKSLQSSTDDDSEQ